MKFRALQENLRKILWQRIDARELSGLRLAQQTGFQQAHISNFLNRKRGLSLDGMDKILTVQRLSILDLLDPAEINRRASIPPPSDDQFQNVLLTDASIAATQSWIRAMHIRGMVKFKKSFLQRLRPETHNRLGKWERFVLIRINATEAASMFPRIRPGALLLLDRH